MDGWPEVPRTGGTRLDQATCKLSSVPHAHWKLLLNPGRTHSTGVSELTRTTEPIKVGDASLLLVGKKYITLPTHRE